MNMQEPTTNLPDTGTYIARADPEQKHGSLVSHVRTSTADRAVDEVPVVHRVMSGGNRGGGPCFEIFGFWIFSQKNGMGDLSWETILMGLYDTLVCRTSFFWSLFLTLKFWV